MDYTQPMQHYSIETYGELQPHVNKEWVLTNGLGGFAGSSIVGCNMRKYHGLLCAATLPPVGRIMALTRIGEIVKIDGSEELLELSINCFGTIFHPRGDKYLRRFELGDTARFTYDVNGVQVIKEVLLLWKQNVVAIRYTINPGKHKVELDLLPFLSLRDFHGERRKGGNWVVEANGLNVNVGEGALQAYISADIGEFIREPDWWTGHILPIETERGLGDIEDLFKPGMYVLKTDKSASITLTCAIDGFKTINWDAEVAKREAEYKRIDIPSASPTIQKLIRASNDFIVSRKTPDGQPGVSIIAGYPWFADWGRDTMISLPGLLLVNKRFEEAAKVLTVFAQYTSLGMIPNRFDDYTNEPHYNTVDASLWFIHACFEYKRLSGDNNTFETKLLPACKEIIRGYREGTRFHIAMDKNDSLITQGDRTTQLTWMDAKLDDIVFTPRQGKAVEINALWYHALRLMGENTLADKVGESFCKAFWISPFRGLADVVSNEGRDTSIRCNQIFAASLPHSPLNEEQRAAVVEVVRRELLTPYGLRTLAATDPKYHPKYGKTRFERDKSYHNGTVWPWPVGAFFEAYLRTNNRSPEAMTQVKAWMQPLVEHLNNDACIGSISEIFDAEPPHRGCGCYAQAWSVAEILRIAVDVGL
jgi:predicted glycogen debranching enzyme